jgi:membrane-associated phospholipid phosphatase
MVFNVTSYFGIQLLLTANKYNFLISFDHIIPFVPEFVWIYHTLLPVILITMFSFVTKKKVFLSAFTAYMIASVVLSAFYISFPSFYPRENFTDSSSISGFLVELTRAIDGANNTFPSGHVTFAWILAFFINLTQRAKKHTWIRMAYYTWAILISFSTLALKQHFIVDVLSGVLLASICYFLSKNIIFKRLQTAN